jgi:hypothetical protein
MKLYASEVQKNIPSGISAKDSLSIAAHFIEHWLREQILLRDAEKSLSWAEKNFDTQLEKYKKELLLQAYYDKLTSDSMQFTCTYEECLQFVQQSGLPVEKDRELLKLNYVRLSPRSKVREELEHILFDETRRALDKKQVEILCGDSLEYYIEDNHWIFSDDLPETISAEAGNNLPKNLNKPIAKTEGKFLYLFVLLDGKNNTTLEKNDERISVARDLLISQKKNIYLQKILNERYQQVVVANK